MVVKMYIVRNEIMFVIILLSTEINTITNQEKNQCKNPSCSFYANELLLGLNRSIDPCDDFYEFSCGNWKNLNPVPETQIRESLFHQQNEKIRRRIRDILENSVAEKNSAVWKAQEMYNHCLENNMTENLNHLQIALDWFGGWPITEGLQWRLRSPIDLLRRLAQIRRTTMFGKLFTVGVTTDTYDTSKKIIQVSQPYRIIEGNSTEEKIKSIKLILALAKTINPFTDIKIALIDARNMVRLSNTIQKNIVLEDSFHIDTAYRKLTLEEMTRQTGFNWVLFLNFYLHGVPRVTSQDVIVVRGFEYFWKMREFFQEPSLVARAIINLELYGLILKIIANPSPDASSVMVSGIISKSSAELPNAQIPRWSKCVDIVSGYYEYALAWKYGNQYMDVQKTVSDARMMAESIFSVFTVRLNNIEWLDETSRALAKRKLSFLKDFYFYPDWTSDEKSVDAFYRELPLAFNLVGDIFYANIFFISKSIEELIRPSRFKTWKSSPLDVNSLYFNPENSLDILEGIMQPPIYDANRLRAMNYGSLGFIIAHEITHGFDMTGMQYDENGNLKTWMSIFSEDQFKNRALCLVRQYSEYMLKAEDIPGSHDFTVDGELTLDENIADNGGIRLAYWAYRIWIDKFGGEMLPEALDDFTPIQIFFISFAHTWCQKYGTYSKWNEVLQEVHAPNKYRIIGTLSNFDEFWKAFGCSSDSKMNRGDENCIIW